jgi:hypothetical protein
MRKLFGLLLFVAAPAFAQQPVDTMLLRRIFALEARVAELQMMVGVQNFNKAQIPCGDMEAARPTFTFINGEYDLAYRNRQFGCAFDPLVQRVTALERPAVPAPIPTDGLQTQITGLAARVGAIESSVAGGQPVGTAVFDQLVARRVCIRDIGTACDDDWNAQLQMHGLGLVNIGMQANIGKLDGQDPNHTHYSQWNVSTDGGTRIQQNAKSSFSRGFVTHVNPCREWLNLGPDSRSALSLTMGSVHVDADAINETNCTPIPHDRAQDLVIKTDEARKKVQFVLTRPLWELEWVYSSVIYAGDIIVPQHPQQ